MIQKKEETFDNTVGTTNIGIDGKMSRKATSKDKQILKTRGSTTKDTGADKAMQQAQINTKVCKTLRFIFNTFLVRCYFVFLVRYAKQER